MQAARFDPRELARVALAKSRARAEQGVPASFRAFLESADYCALTLSPVVQAIADASDGNPVSCDDATAQSTFGCAAVDLPRCPRRVVVVRAGGRGGKTSRLLATKAIHASLTVPLPDLRTGERGRALLIAPDKALALQALSFVRGYLEAPALAGLVANDTAECITIRRPDGKLVDIAIGAATRGGKAARGRSLVFVGMDEAAFFYADDGHTVTDKDIYDAAIQRVVPGGQIWIVSTPWIEDAGVMEERLKADWGKHTSTLCAVGTTRALNPKWDPSGEIEAEMRREDPENAAREIDAVPLSAGVKMFFAKDDVDAAVETGRTDSLEYDANFPHAAGTDLGFTRNSAALALARTEGRRVRVAYTEELRPERGTALKPSVVCKGFAEACVRHGVDSVQGDHHYEESAKELMGECGVSYLPWTPTVDSKALAFTTMRRLMAERRLGLPDDIRLLSQIRRTTSKPMAGGGTQILLPKQGTAHGDLLMACVLACAQAESLAGVDTKNTKFSFRPRRW